MSRFWISLLFLFFVYYTIVCQNEKPSVKILAPQFICGSPKSEVENVTSLPVAKPGMTTIRFHTKSGQKLTFNWTVRFQVLNGPRGQRFNLLVWRAVRSLETTLNSMSAEIFETNSVAINNSLLVEGVNYIFDVSGVNKQGVVGETNSFAIKYNDAKSELNLGSGTSTTEFSVLMLGSDVIYADMMYVIEAHVTPCKPTNDYYFSWCVTELESKSNINIGKQIGKQLKILPGVLIGGQSYDISCKILKISDSSFIASNGLYLSVLSRGMSVELNIELLTLANNVPFTFMATLKNPDNVQGVLNYDWTCKILPGLTECDDFTSSNKSEINFESGFSNEGIYLYEVNVVKGDSKASRKAQIIVQNAMLPIIDIGSSMRLAVSGLPLEIQAQISDLRPGCNLQWMILKENGYAYFDPELLPRVFGNSLSINSMEETFLSEIVEFGNNTFSRNFPLVIPAANGNWPGLKPEVKYKFRLQVQCTCTASVQCEGPNEVLAYSDVSIETNDPPTAMPLKVKPPSGTALQTIFTFSTKAAADIPKDHPMKYTFGFKTTSSDIVFLNSYIENLALETILPYSAIPLLPVLVVCDSRGACNITDGDPITILKPARITQAELNGFKDRFEANLYRMEYTDAFNLLTFVLQTLKVLDEKKAEEFMISSEQSLRFDINKQLADVNSINIMAANNFIQQSTKFIQKFDISNELLQDILSFRDTVFEIVSESSNKSELDYRKKRESSSLDGNHFLYLGHERRQSTNKKRSKRDMSSEDVKNFLKMSEYIIQTSKDEVQVLEEKRKIVSYLDISAPNLCKKSTKFPSILDSQLVFLSFERIVPRPGMANIYIPYFPRMGYKVNVTSVAHMQFLTLEKMNNPYCIAKHAFAIDILSKERNINHKGWVYHTALYYADGINDYKKSKESYPILLKVPVQSTKLNEKDVLQCRRWKSDTWDEETCESNDNYEMDNNKAYVVCKCDSLGYISLYSVNKSTMGLSNPVKTTNEYTKFEDNTIPTILTSPTTKVYKEMYDIVESSTYTTSNLVLNNLTVCRKGICVESNKNDYVVAFSISIFSIIFLGIISSLFIINKWKIRKKNQLVLTEKNRNKKYPKYRKFFAEHLMEGSSESLVKYNILKTRKEN